ncbi:MULTISPECIES: type II toxin-antitoxin system ParD family antitoxin [unclassified Mesorhizobium]|uniref:type II toxin-antitoxin system ParD family antitoxin n=1 Tax=unclassified Mesorhizobium TaxID=325217 RepID=UPI001127F814|nr:MULTISPECIES: type II toxin-antitoxin system ParD family antitoxin [unclassified Mesorhizobium]MBZ9739042.1 type II toxin-antitoxin system ParD family antitoxin [Mesorhizobium sp. CO1-1-4]MBZ9802655.1 type II toxin-antitoxin system ParD family antitoxin [Mesorhizobium sp. ES1-6]MBZ9995456.1 type II toxin-antitoxin system ParD family antitoxin [Mesorhizobium sp. BH1-1-4]TPL91722.1 type II toxin-antitoxin system ParD family antitoxin [Mesorhizobium sp. B2-3-12]
MKTEPMRTLTISLTPQQAARLQRAVDAGGYASNSEVVREALRLWEQREELRVLELDQLKRAYADGMASGKPVDVEPAEFLRSLKAERRARG